MDLKINREVEQCERDTLVCNPSYAPTQKEILRLVDFYWVNKYKDGEYDETGYRKSFYNVIINPTEIASKMIDLDTKDIQIKAEDGQSFYPAWLMGKDLRIWMKSKKNKDGRVFGQLLNDMVYSLPKYGHLLVKKAKDTIYIVPLQNVFNEPNALNFLSSRFLIESHEYTPDELRNQGWDNVENVIYKYGKTGKITIYERSGVIEGEPKYNYVIVPKGGGNYPEDILFIDKIDRKDLFKEIKWDNIPGRASGRGTPERLFEGQIAKNSNENLLRSGYRWTSRHLFQSRDQSITRNLIADLFDGEVLPVESEITPIAVEERNLPAIREGDSKWDKNIADLTFAYEPMGGQKPSSGTPLGTSILQTRMSGQYFDLKREDLGMFIKDILFDWIIPNFKNQTRNEHSIMLGEFDEDELGKIKELILTNKTNKSIVKNIIKTKIIPSMDEVDILRGIELEKLKKSKDISIPKGYYDDLKYKIDIVITNEQIDLASRMSTYQTILQIIGTNPTILQDKRARKIFYKLLDLSGISPVDFGIDETPELAQTMAKQGGSIAKITPVATPQMATNQQQL